MTQAATVVRLAHGEVGYKEKPVNRTKYGAWYGMDGQPYCAMGLSYIFWSAGLPLPAQSRKGFASCELGLEWFKRMGLFTRTGRGPFKVGDIYFNQFDSDLAADHVGLIVETKAKSVVGVEFNTSPTNAGSQSNGGGVYVRERSLNLIIGVGRPPYTVGPPPSPPTPAKPPVWPGRYLSLTSPYTTGVDVKALQKKLIQFGSKITADGVFGRGTYDNVRWWQSAFGLVADGVVGPQTWHTFHEH